MASYAFCVGDAWATMGGGEGFLTTHGDDGTCSISSGYTNARPARPPRATMIPSSVNTAQPTSRPRQLGPPTGTGSGLPLALPRALADGSSSASAALPFAGGTPPGSS